MPDISMCNNKECSLSLKCHRFTAIPSEYRQTYASFKPNEDGECFNFWDNKGEIKNDKIQY
jgi:hypothetical protein